MGGAVCAWAFGTGWLRPLPASAGTNACVGAPGHTAQPGGVGGSGGIWEPVNDVSAFHFHPYKAIEANRSDLGDSNRSGATGADGTDGANGGAIGTITGNSYTPTNGMTGTDGNPGPGGAGGQGRSPEPDFDPSTAGIRGVWRGMGGAGGGAGGCPGLAGSGAKGGGASIAALIVDSDVTFEGTELRAGRGGDAGRGALGSAPTPGGLPGTNLLYSPMAGKNGGRGGTAGVSGNGGNGPSVGIAHVGRAPTVRATTVTPGAGGTAIPARSRDTLGVTKTIPATSAGVSKAILAL